LLEKGELVVLRVYISTEAGRPLLRSSGFTQGRAWLSAATNSEETSKKMFKAIGVIIIEYKNRWKQKHNCIQDAFFRTEVPFYRCSLNSLLSHRVNFLYANL
jgi:hypothetical protein